MQADLAVVVEFDPGPCAFNLPTLLLFPPLPLRPLKAPAAFSLSLRSATKKSSVWRPVMCPGRTCVGSALGAGDSSWTPGCLVTLGGPSDFLLVGDTDGEALRAPA